MRYEDAVLVCSVLRKSSEVEQKNLLALDVIDARFVLSGAVLSS